MKKILITSLILFSSFTAYCQPGYKQYLRHIATITFPDTPKTKTISTSKVYLLHYGTSLYMAQVTPLQAGLRDLFVKNDLDSTYANFISGVIGGSKGNLIYKKNIAVNGLKGVEFGFTSKAKNQSYYCYMQMVYLNDVFIDYSFWSPDSLSTGNKKIASFFDTFKLTIKPDKIRQDSVSNIAYDTGTVIGKLVGFGLIFSVIALIGLGIVFIIRRMT